MKKEFIKAYKPYLENWTGNVSVFQNFDEFIEENIFIPPKILLVGEKGVGKTTIMDLFPGETIIELDDDLVETIQKPIDFIDKQCLAHHMQLYNSNNNKKEKENEHINRIRKTNQLGRVN